MTGDVVGVVGLNERGREFVTHLIELGCTVIATDANDKLRTSVANQFDSDVVVTDSLSELLEYPIERAIVTTPSRYHLDPVKRFLSEGYDVLLEKPLAHTLDAAEAITDVSNTSEADCRVAFQLRCSMAAHVLRSEIQAGELGEVYHAEASYIMPRNIPGLGSWMTSRDLSGGGALIDVGVHVLDLVHYLIGFKNVQQITGVTRQRFDPSEYDTDDMYGDAGTRKRSDVEDSATAFITYADNTTVHTEASWAANQPPKRAVRLYGTKRGALIDQYNEKLVIFEPEMPC